MSDHDRAMMYRLQANQAKLDLQESFVLFTSNVRKTRSPKSFLSTYKNVDLQKNANVQVLLVCRNRVTGVFNRHCLSLLGGNV